jgi:hypothetical protein
MQTGRSCTWCNQVAWETCLVMAALTTCSTRYPASMCQPWHLLPAGHRHYPITSSCHDTLTLHFTLQPSACLPACLSTCRPASCWRQVVAVPQLPTVQQQPCCWRWMAYTRSRHYSTPCCRPCCAVQQPCPQRWCAVLLPAVPLMLRRAPAKQGRCCGSWRRHVLRPKGRMSR